MDGPRDQWSSQNGSLIRTHDGGVPYLPHASQLEAQHANDRFGLSPAHQWAEDSHLKHTRQGQHRGSESYSKQHTPREAANYRGSSIQEETMITVSEFDTAHGTTSDGLNAPMPIPSLSWHQEEKFLHQQPEASIGTSSHHQHSNGSTNEFIRVPSAAAENETWPTFNIFYGSQNTHHVREMQMVAEQNASDATYSMLAHRDPESVHPNHNSLETPMSNMLTGYCPYPLEPSASICRMNFHTSSHPTSFKSPSRLIHAPGPKLSPGYKRQKHARRLSSLSKTGGHRDGSLPHQGYHLAPPMQRRVSSASSQTTEATSSSAISDYTPEVLKCPVETCEAAFFGKSRKGNRKRHVRALHFNRAPIECKDCAKTFGRSDALLKHSRKQHPKGVADVSPVSRSEGTGLRDEH